MFKDESMQFMLYILGIGVMIVLSFCIMQVFILEQDVPFLNDFGLGNRELGEFEYDDPPPTIIEEGKDYQAEFQTNLGDFTVELFEDNAPTTVNNFVFLASEGYYDGVKVHRVLEDFLFQTGDRNTLDDNISIYGEGDPGYTFGDEINWPSLNLSDNQIASLTSAGYESNPNVISKPLQRYSLTMANAGANSNGSQFFIVTAPNTDPRLDELQGRHTVFGKVIEGFDTIEDINNAPVEITDKNAPLPLKDIIIQRIDIIEMNE